MLSIQVHMDTDCLSSAWQGLEMASCARTDCWVCTLGWTTVAAGIKLNPAVKPRSLAPHLAGVVQGRIGAVVVSLDLGDAEHRVVAFGRQLVEALPVPASAKPTFTEPCASVAEA